MNSSLFFILFLAQIVIADFLFAASSSSINGIASAKIVENKIEIGVVPLSPGSPAAAAYNFQIAINGGSVIEEKPSDKSNKFATTYAIVSKPNTSVNVIYGGAGGHEGKEDGEDVFIIELRNADGEVIKVKMKSSDSIYFDKEGRGGLNIAPKMDFGNSKLKGTYKATYDVIISY